MLSTWIISFIVLVLLVFGVFSFIKRGRKGCCSASSDEKIQAIDVDEDESHYRYRYEYSIEGMHCVNCQRRIEENLDRIGETFARCDWRKGSLILFSKKEINSIIVLDRLEALGYKAVLKGKQ